jgi:hypothetical protein
MLLEVHAAASVRTVLWNVPPSGRLLLADHTLKMEILSSHATQCEESNQRTNGCMHLSWHIYIGGSDSSGQEGMRIENRTPSDGPGARPASYACGTGVFSGGGGRSG